MSMVDWIQNGRATVQTLDRYATKPIDRLSEMVRVDCDGRLIGIGHRWRSALHHNWSRVDPKSIYFSDRTFKAVKSGPYGRVVT